MPDEPDAERFAKILATVAANFSPISLCVARQGLVEGGLPPRALCVTFDDGYADNLLVAAPILKRFGIPATVFVASGYLDGRVMWNDRVIESVRRAEGDAMDLTDLGYGRHPLGDATERVSLINRLLMVLEVSSVRGARATDVGGCEALRARYAVADAVSVPGTFAA